MTRYYQLSPLEIIRDMNDKLLNENVAALSAGSMLFNQDGVIVTDDIEEEYIPEGAEITVVESEFAQEISWMMLQLHKGLDEVKTYFRKNEFSQLLADAANSAIKKGTDLTGILLSILQEATFLTAQTMQMKAENLRDEVMSCVGSLNDVIERI